MKREELSQKLFENIKKVEPYPNLVANVDAMIDVTAFFPGGKGLWIEEESVAFPSILILGQDFGTEKGHIRMLRHEENDLDCPTWRNLRKLFAEADVKLTECFFSNVFMQRFSAMSIMRS